ncbi:hypothetical protein [Tropicibacter sp. S64]|uniref:hypothetical protein n=1 Tax=Tropicibacter sp. S64 TaxID=3415122 RepID=UPI003C799034
MHPFIYSCKLTQTPKNLARFRLRPGDDLEVSVADDHVAMLARPRTWTSRLIGGAPRAIGRIGAEHEPGLRKLVEEGRHMRIRVVNIDGFADRPKGVSISVWVDERIGGGSRRDRQSAPGGLRKDDRTVV